MKAFLFVYWAGFLHWWVTIGMSFISLAPLRLTQSYHIFSRKLFVELPLVPQSGFCIWGQQCYKVLLHVFTYQLVIWKPSVSIYFRSGGLSFNLINYNWQVSYFQLKRANHFEWTTVEYCRSTPFVEAPPANIFQTWELCKLYVKRPIWPDKRPLSKLTQFSVKVGWTLPGILRYIYDILPCYLALSFIALYWDNC